MILRFFEKKGLPFFSALLVDGAKVDGGFEVSREGRTLTVKPDGLTTDDVGTGSMVRLEWEQAEVNLDRFAEGSIRGIDFFCQRVQSCRCRGLSAFMPDRRFG